MSRLVRTLAVVATLAVLALVTRSHWLPLVGIGGGTDLSAGAAEGIWEPLTPEGAERARRAIAALGERSGPVYASVRPGDLASHIYQALARQLPRSAQDVQAAAFGDQLHVRATVEVAEFGGPGVLGPLASFLGSRDTVQFGGTVEVLRPGLAQFHVRQVKLRQLSLPQGAIPRLLAQVRRGTRPDGVADDALPLEIPPAIADVRVAKGRVTLYKAARDR